MTDFEVKNLVLAQPADKKRKENLFAPTVTTPAHIFQLYEQL